MSTFILRGQGLYCHLVKPSVSVDDDGKEKPEEYSITLLITKEDMAKYREVLKTANKRAVANWNSKNRPLTRSAVKALPQPVKDGDRYFEEDPGRHEAYKGCYFIRAKSRRPPGLIDKTGRVYSRESPITEDLFRSGCIFNVSMNPVVYEYMTKKGITYYLNNVMVLEKREALFGPSSAQDDFKGFIDPDAVTGFDDIDEDGFSEQDSTSSDSDDDGFGFADQDEDGESYEEDDIPF